MLKQIVSHALLLSIAVIALAIVGCASEPYVVLLDNGDGTTGKVLVNSKEGTTVLENANQATVIGDTKDKTFTVDQEKFHKDFDPALESTPQKPSTFLLYFISGTSRLTKASSKEIPKILEETKHRAAPDISVIGHTDTVDDSPTNEWLSLKRAETIAKQFIAGSIPADRILIESHGEKNLLIKTPDNTDEPRNRRVEITVR